MKKNLTIIAIALLVLAMAIPASAASLSLAGEYSATFTYKHRVPTEGDPVPPPYDTWESSYLEGAGKLKLNLTFKEGEAIVAYLPLTATLVGLTAPKVEVGSWYFEYNTAPWAFWASKNDEDNEKQFESLGDPLGLVATVGDDTMWALNAKGDIVGAGLNLYAVDYNGWAAWLGRATYGLPLDFQLGLVGAYTDMAPGHLVFGADVTGKVPGIDADLTLAAAGSWWKEGAWKFVAPPLADNDNYAFMAKLENIKFDPISAWVKYTAVGPTFGSIYATNDDDILDNYADSAAAEIEVSADLPVGIPTTLTLGDTLWMDYPTDPKWNETTGKAVVKPLENLTVTVSGAYKADLDDVDTKDYKGYKAHGDVAYKAFGLTLTPYADYKVDSYADQVSHDGKFVDTIVGMKVSGSPLAGLDLNAEGSYQIEDLKTALKAWGVYTTELNPGFVKSAKTQVAGFGSYSVNKTADVSEDPTAQDPKTEFYGYAGSDLGITDNLTGKVGILTKDSKGTFAAHAALTYQASDSISTALAYTYRHTGLSHPVGSWEPFADQGKNFLKASVTGTVGKSTITLAYGASGLKAADTSGFHKDKAWAWLRNYPTAPMDWQLLTLTVKVPF